MSPLPTPLRPLSTPLPLSLTPPLPPLPMRLLDGASCQRFGRQHYRLQTALVRHLAGAQSSHRRLYHALLPNDADANADAGADADNADVGTDDGRRHRFSYCFERLTPNTLYSVILVLSSLFLCYLKTEERRDKRTVGAVGAVGAEAVTRR